MSELIYLCIMVILTEATTQLVVKGSILYEFRAFLEKTSEFLGKLFTCGYCFSVWASLLWNAVFFLTNNYILVVEPLLLNFIVSVILVHRLSNYLHGLSDRFFETYKDLRYQSEDD